MRPRFLLSLPALALSALAFVTIAAPVRVHAQAAVSVTAPENGDRIVPGTPFVISASATTSALPSPVTGVEFFVVPNKGQIGPQLLPSADPATAVALLGAQVTFVQITNPGSKYTAPPQVVISDGLTVFNTIANIDATGQVVSVDLTGAGLFNFTNVPTVTISPPADPTGVQAAGSAGFSVAPLIFVLTFPPGTVYDPDFPPAVTVTPPQLPGGTQAVAELDFSVAPPQLLFTNAGSGYTAAPTITVASPRGGFSAGSVALNPFVATATLPGNDRYTLYAVATYLDGTAATSVNSPVVVGEQGRIPTVSITTPTAATTGLTADVPFEVRSNATFPGPPADGDAVATYELFVNGALFASATNPTFSYTPDTEGYYALVVRATTLRGLVADSAPVVVNVTQGTPPTISITSPVALDTLTPGIPATIIAAVEGKSGTITQVDFVVNGQVVGSAAAEPFIAGFTPSAAGPYTIFARATDSLGNVKDSVAVTVNAVAPSGAQPLVSLTQPTGATSLVGGSKLYLNATATKADGTFDTGMNVEFLVNGLPVAGVREELPPGAFATTFDVSRAPFSYVVQAVATQADGTKGSSSTLTITSAVAQNQLPQVQMLELLPGTNPGSKGGVVPLRARAFFPATANANARVEFFANGVYLGEQSTAVNGIYTLDWTVPTTLTDNAVRITARAIAVNFGGGGGGGSIVVGPTANGSSLSTNLITLNLQAGEVPVPAVTFPSTTGTIPVGIATEIRATVDNLASGSIANVDFYANGVLVGSDTTAPYAVPWTPTSAGLYSLAAVATSTFGIEGVSASGYSVSVTSGLPPTVNLTSPATTPATVAVNSTVVLAADANDIDGSVVSVTFLANGLPLPATAGDENPDTVAPYRYNFVPTSAGRYEIVARAIDDLGNVTDSAPVTVTAVQGSPPTVDLQVGGGRGAEPVAAPELGIGRSGNEIALTMSARNGVDYILEETADLSSGIWTPSTAKMTTTADQSGVSQGYTRKQVSVPVVGGKNFFRVVYPVTAGDNFSVNQTATLEATADDSDGTVARVEFLVNGVVVQTVNTGPYRFSYQLTAPGRYEIVARAYDNLGNVKDSTPRIVTVTDGAAPTIDLTSPTIPATANVGQTVRLAASAGATSGAITTVEFLVNDAVVATAAQAPYTHDFLIANPGVYTIVARAIGTFGAVATSTPVILNAGLPVGITTVSIVSPAADTKFIPGTTFTALASVTSDIKAPIASATYYLNGVPVGAPLTTEPFSQQVSLTSTGSYDLVVIASDIYGNSGTDKVKIFCEAPASGAAPIISMTHPVPGGQTSDGQIDNVNDFSVPSQLFFNAQVVLPTDVTVDPEKVVFFASGEQLTETVTRYNNTFAIRWQPRAAGPYNITAQVTDSRGFTAVSVPLFFDIGALARPLPQIELLPLAFTEVAAGSVVTVQARSNQGITVINRIDFYANQVLIGTAEPRQVNNEFVTTAFQWGPPAAGDYSITARAVQTIPGGASGGIPGADNSVISAPQTLKVVAAVGQTPSVILSQQTIAESRYVVGSEVFVNATATPRGGATVASNSVFFYFSNEKLQGTLTGLKAGGQEIFAARTAVSASAPAIPVFATAIDSNKNTGTSEISTLASVAPLRPLPSVQILPLLPGTALDAGGEVVLRAKASFPVTASEEARVEFYANGAYAGVGEVDAEDPQLYTLRWVSPTGAGAYVVEARAVALNFQTNTGNDNAVRNYSSVISENSIAVNTIPGNAPTVAITAPVDGATVSANQPLTLRADAFVPAPATTITKVISPQSGTITAVRVTQGQVIAVGTPLVDIEVEPGFAGTVSSTVAGTVQSINVSVGLPVMAGAVLLEILPSATVVAAPSAANGGTVTSIVLVGAVVQADAPLVGVSLPGGFGGSVRSPIAGVVTKVSVNLGDALTTGQALVEVQAGAGLGGTVDRVEFYANGALVGVDETAPYEATFTPESVGLYNLAALAYSDAGLIGTSEVVQVSSVLGTPPTVTLTAPAKGVMGQTARLIATPSTAMTGRNIEQVEFLVNNLVVETLTEANSGSSYVFDYPVNKPGNYLLQARATDNVGNVALSNVLEMPTRTAPSVLLTAPTSAVIGQTITMSATVVNLDAEGKPIEISAVQFLVNGLVIGQDSTPPYAVNYLIPAAGTYELQARAIDQEGVTGLSNIVTITVPAPPPPDPTAPTIAFVSPSAGSTVQIGALLGLTAVASPGDNASISSVVFDIVDPTGGRTGLVATLANSAYVASFVPIVEGVYGITAFVTNSRGQQAVATISVIAQSVPPPPVGGNEAFVLDMYGKILTRLPTSAELSASITLLNGGQPRATFVFNLVQGDEYANMQNRIADFLYTLGVTPSRELFANYVAVSKIKPALMEGGFGPTWPKPATWPGTPPFNATMGQVDVAQQMINGLSSTIRDLDNTSFVNNWLFYRLGGFYTSVANITGPMGGAPYAAAGTSKGAATSFTTAYYLNPGSFNPEALNIQTRYQYQLKATTVQFLLGGTWEPRTIPGSTSTPVNRLDNLVITDSAGLYNLIQTLLGTVLVTPSSAAATATITGGLVNTPLTVTAQGGGYSASLPPLVVVAPPPVAAGTTQAVASAVSVAGGFVTGISLGNRGSGYATAPAVLVAPPPSFTAAPNVEVNLSATGFNAAALGVASVGLLVDNVEVKSAPAYGQSFGFSAPTEAGQYSLVVRARNANGEQVAVSAPVTLIVAP